MSQQNRARDPRLSVMLNAFVTVSGSNGPTRHRVINLSVTGIQIAAAGHLRVGQNASLSVGMVRDVAAETIWLRDGTAGLHFHEPIDLEAARQRAPATDAPPAKAGWIVDLEDPYRRKPARPALRR